MNKIELLAPAGNLEKAKLALIYGADAVYVGGKKFSLRARASNFDVCDIEELCKFAHSLSKKVYVTMNILPHDEDFDGLEEYILNILTLKMKSNDHTLEKEITEQYDRYSKFLAGKHDTIDILEKKCNQKWLSSFSLGFSMIIGMAVAVLVG